MRVAKPIDPGEVYKSREVDIESNIPELTPAGAALHRPKNGNDEMSATDLGTLVRRVSEASTREIENLIEELHGLRKKLESAADRIQSDIAKYAELSQGVIQLTTIISDNVKRLPAGAHR
jgi:hypothetical protein